MLLKIIIILFSLSLYLTQIPFMASIDILPFESAFIDSLIQNTAYIEFADAILIAICMGIFTIVFTILKTIKVAEKPQLVKDLIDGMLLIKLIHIPYFAFNFIIYTLIAALLSITGIGMPITIIVGAIVAGSVLFVTSLYTIIVLYRCLKLRLLTTNSFVLLVISQFFFCIDVICVVIAYFIIKKRYKSMFCNN